MGRVIQTWTAALGAGLGFFPPGSAVADGVGGGWADSGVLGAYYASEEPSKEPAFRRRDVRIDFRWDRNRRVGGSRAEPHRSFPDDNFSVRWTGRLLPRFSEPYRFSGVSDGPLTIRLEDPGASGSRVIFSRSEGSGLFSSAPVELEAGKSYDVSIEYRHSQGRGVLRLAWSSPSTPEEVIDPAVQQGINAATYRRFVWADQTKTARLSNTDGKLDELGWPLPEAEKWELVLAESSTQQPDMSGTYLIRFPGKARVMQSCCGRPIFTAGGKEYERGMPWGAGFDDRTGYTTATVHTTGSRTMLWFMEKDSRRRVPVKNLRVMRPLRPGSTEHHRPDEVVDRGFEAAVRDHYTAIRWLRGANYETESTWDGRALPAHQSFRGENGQENWEYLIMLANETGKDLSLTLPIAADDEYFENLALLLRYGSDGRQPYRKPVEDPKYPPLNSNLRVYLEVGNEIWNWAFPSTKLAQKLTQAEADKKSALWKIIDYDGAVKNPGGMRAIRRWLAMRTVALGRALRRTFSDAAMGTKVRVYVGYQYTDEQRTASHTFRFLDDYFNHLAPLRGQTPRPVSHFVWGAGGATYYRLANADGQQSKLGFEDAGFARPRLKTPTVRMRPKNSPWTFEGKAGIVRGGEERIGPLAHLPEIGGDGQVAFLMDGGSVAQRVDLPPGTYALAFGAAGSDRFGWPGHAWFDIYVDDETINPLWQNSIQRARGQWHLRGWGRNIRNLNMVYSSAVFRVEKPGRRTIRFRAKKSDEPRYILLNDVRIVSADAMFDSGFRRGSAQGASGTEVLADQIRRQSIYPRTFGLPVIAYEAGWSLGGDHRQSPLQNWSKLRDPRAEKVNDQVIELWDRSGSFMQVWGVYTYFPPRDAARADRYPLMKSLRKASASLRSEPTFGKELPASLELEQADWSRVASSGQSFLRRSWKWLTEGSAKKPDWYSWMLVAPESGHYVVSVRGGRVRAVEIDGRPLELADGHSAPVFVTRGAHALRAVLPPGGRVKAIQVQKAP